MLTQQKKNMILINQYHLIQSGVNITGRKLYVNREGGLRISPMAAIELAIIDIAIQKSNMNQPLTVAKGLQLENSLIKLGPKLDSDVITTFLKEPKKKEDMYLQHDLQLIKNNTLLAWGTGKGSISDIITYLCLKKDLVWSQS